MTEPTKEQLHQAAVLMGDPKALALEWIKTYLAKLVTNPDPELVIHYMYYLVNQDTVGWKKFLSFGGIFQDEYLCIKFWENLAVLKDVDISNIERCKTINYRDIEDAYMRSNNYVRRSG